MISRVLIILLITLLIIPLSTVNITAQTVTIYSINTVLTKHSSNDPTNFTTILPLNNNNYNNTGIYCTISSNRQESDPYWSIKTQDFTSSSTINKSYSVIVRSKEYYCNSTDYEVVKYDTTNNTFSFRLGSHNNMNAYYTVEYNYSNHDLKVYYNSNLVNTYTNAKDVFKCVTGNSTLDATSRLSVGFIQRNNGDFLVVIFAVPTNLNQSFTLSTTITCSFLTFSITSNSIACNRVNISSSVNNASISNISNGFYVGKDGANNYVVYSYLNPSATFNFKITDALTTIGNTSCVSITLNPTSYLPATSSSAISYFTLPNVQYVIDSTFSIWASNNSTYRYTALMSDKFSTGTFNITYIRDTSGGASDISRHSSALNTNIYYNSYYNIFLYNLNPIITINLRVILANNDIITVGGHLILLKSTHVGNFGLNRQYDFYAYSSPSTPSHVTRYIYFPYINIDISNSTNVNNSVFQVTFTNLDNASYVWRVIDLNDPNKIYSGGLIDNRNAQAQVSLYAGYPSNSTGLFQLLDNNGAIVFQNVFNLNQTYLINLLDYQSALKSINQTWSINYSITNTYIIIYLSPWSYFDTLSVTIKVFDGSNTSSNTYTLSKTTPISLSRDSTKSYLITVINNNRTNDFVTFNVPPNNYLSGFSFLTSFLSPLKNLGTHIFGTNNEIYLFILIAIMFISIDALLKTYVGSILGIAFLITLSVTGLINNIHQYFMVTLIIVVAIILQYLRGKI